MKTNVSIKFNSVEEYREIESKLIELGYKADKKWNDYFSKKFNNIIIYKNKVFMIYIHNGNGSPKTYNSLQEFLNDNAKTH